MASFNKVLLIGNLTRDPQVRFLSGGMAVCEIGLAVNSSYKNKAGQKIEEASFFDVVFFGKTAEIMGEYLNKGSSIHVEGRLKQETWDDKATGQKRSKVKVIGESMQMLGSRGGAKPGGESRPANQPSQESDDGGSSYEPSESPPSGDEIPF